MDWNWRWNKADGNPPNVPPFEGGDSRKLVVLVDADSMTWIGIRYYRPDLREWHANGQKESARITHWMNLPAMPLPSES